jgi:hypothetical protein
MESNHVHPFCTQQNSNAFCIIKHPTCNIAISNAIKEQFHVLHPIAKGWSNQTITLSEFEPRAIIHCFHAAQGKLNDISAEAKSILDVAAYLQPQELTYKTIIQSLIHNFINSPTDIYKISKKIMATQKDFLPYLTSCIYQYAREEEQQQQVLDVLYEKMFDVPLFKKHTIANYNDDLQQWSATNCAYQLYDALSKMRYEFSCQEWLNHNRKYLDDHKNTSIKSRSNGLFQQILSQTMSWHDIHILLQNSDYIKPLFSTDEGCENLSIDISYPDQRLFFPLIAKVALTAIHAKENRYISKFEGHSIDQARIRKIYGVDIEALSAPCFNNKYKCNTSDELLINPVFKRLIYGLLPPRLFTLSVRLNQNQLPIDILRKVPVGLCLKLYNPLPIITYQGDDYCENQEQIYLFDPWWRVKTIARLGLFGITLYGLYRCINAYTDSQEQLITNTHKARLDEIIHAISSVDIKMALHYFIEKKPLLSITRNHLSPLYNGISDVPTTFTKSALDLAMTNIKRIRASEKVYQDKHSTVYTCAFLCKIGAPLLALVPYGLSLITDTLALLWPRVFGRSKCCIQHYY